MPTRQSTRSSRGQNITGQDVNYYRLLGVDYSASTQEITRAYRAAMKQVHPDRVQGKNREEAEDRAKLLNHAYRVLSRPASRSKYDFEIKAKALQDQIMSRYFGGLGVPGGGDEVYDQVRMAAAAERRRQQRRNTSQAALSLFVVFTAFLIVVIVALVTWSVVSSAIESLF
jgi:DnaJ-class molecular chaperone